ncbi:hypothetical protein [Shouchella hunanensis]|uniref:Phage protein n=1 Tax=Shouchella hunanensis TaxID=766894 RepID=A0ABY7W518_9BACI|nr:hypothetical protein [Shouchella hunanensis]WDF02965.1 hypothetical protein PQ477_15875 [Shouchella hunanensis]
MLTIYFNIDEKGYVDGYSTTECYTEYNMNVNENHEVLSNPYIFKLIDGELIKDEEKQKAIIEESEKQRNQPTLEELNALAILELAEKLERGEG